MNANSGSMLEVPDLSHLTHEEQQKILDVIQRQQDEEKRERLLLCALQDQFEDYKSHIKTNVEESKLHAGEDNNPVCDLCFKTKFAEGCGHICAFCAAKFCSRCGGRITIKSNKTMWVCNLCRKEKEILTRTGAWYHGHSNDKLSVTSKSLQGLEKEISPTEQDSTGKQCADGGGAVDLMQSLKRNSAELGVIESPSVVGPDMQHSDFVKKDEAPISEQNNKIQKVETVPNFQTYTSRVAQSASVSDIYQAEDFRNNKDIVMEDCMQAAPLGPNLFMEHTAAKDATTHFHSKSMQCRGHVVEDLLKEAKVETTKPPFNKMPKEIGPSISKLNCYPEQNEESLPSAYRKNYKKQDHDQGSLVSLDDNCSMTDYSSYGEGEKETSISDYEYNSQQSTNMSHFYHSESPVDHCSCHEHSSAKYINEGRIRSLQHQSPIFWQPSADGRFLIGQLTLCKNAPIASVLQESGSLLGLKVVGGKTTPCGRLGAFVTKVRKDSLADTVGHLKPGDEIISWNKHCLQDSTFHEVYEIILKSKADTVVELVVSRPIRDTPRIPETRLRQTAESSSCSLDSDKREIESFPNKRAVGKVEIKMWYDPNTCRLFVTALRAVDLSPREGGLLRNPYLKMYLLPDRSNDVERRTKTVKKTLSPEWLQTFLYEDVRKDDLGAMALELTLWDFDLSLEANNKFIGEVIVDLGLVCLNDEPHCFKLMPVGYGLQQDYEASTFTPISASLVSSSVNLSEMSARAIRSGYNLRCHEAECCINFARCGASRRSECRRRFSLQPTITGI